MNTKMVDGQNGTTNSLIVLILLFFVSCKNEYKVKCGEKLICDSIVVNYSDNTHGYFIINSSSDTISLLKKDRVYKQKYQTWFYENKLTGFYYYCTIYNNKDTLEYNTSDYAVSFFENGKLRCIERWKDNKINGFIDFDSTSGIDSCFNILNILTNSDSTLLNKHYSEWQIQVMLQCPK